MIIQPSRAGIVGPQPGRTWRPYGAVIMICGGTITMASAIHAHTTMSNHAGPFIPATPSPAGAAGTRAR